MRTYIVKMKAFKKYLVGSSTNPGHYLRILRSRIKVGKAGPLTPPIDQYELSWRKEPIDEVLKDLQRDALNFYDQTYENWLKYKIETGEVKWEDVVRAVKKYCEVK